MEAAAAIRMVPLVQLPKAGIDPRTVLLGCLLSREDARGSAILVFRHVTQ